ncbi:saccharopine dehydrogenase family protein [Rhodococcus globerulus]|uniref:Saccharopine dehydrogenase n=1 Tax=Rhodococcus globerulus TaxID=33008 RepID=A0ABU4BTY4_RHOGO|nr:hypothetical protein [Rhodococcus globerulus]MDV6267662.1 hypothetical protein [Rhodococcus globerulus]
MKVLVLGGYGAVGVPLMEEFRTDPAVSAFSAGRNAARADVAVDLTDQDAYSRAVSGYDVVVNASGFEDVRLAQQAVRGGATFVDITATSAYCDALENVDGPVLLGVGLAPGLTSVLAAEAHRLGSGPVDIMVGLGGGELHGPAATAWTYGMLGTRFRDPSGELVRNYTGMKVFDVPAEAPGYRKGPAVRADFSDQHALTRDLGVPVRTYLRLDTSAATLGLAAMTWAPPLQKVVPKKMWGSDRWIVMARTETGPTLWASGRSQSAATAMIAARAVDVIRQSPIARPTWLHSVESTESLQAGIPALVVRQT